MTTETALKEKEDLRAVAFVSGILLKSEIKQKKEFRKMVKALTYSTSERQKKYREKKKKTGQKQILLWVKNDPKYEYAGADIHVENIGICKRESKVLVAMEAFMGYLKSENVLPELLEDIAGLFMIFGFEGEAVDLVEQKNGAPDIPEAS